MNCILLIEFLAHVSTLALEGKFLKMNACILIICSDYLTRIFSNVHKIMFYLSYMQA